MMRKRDGDGTGLEEEHAKVAGVFVIAYRKFQVSGISGKVTGEGHRKF